MRTGLLGLIFSSLMIMACLTASDAPLVTQSEPVEPGQAVETLRSHAQTRVELVAAEPDVVDPVSARFDSSGRLWVVEMRDYPTGPRDGDIPGGRIVVLQEGEGGRMTQRSVFAEGLLFPTGVLPWKDGAIVTLAGAVLFFRDRDGDLVSDETETWFEGFSQDNTQLRANHPTLAADGRVYIAGGLRGGQVVSRDPRWSTSEPVNLAGRDFAFDVRGGWCGAVVGNSQFGLAISDDGTRFVCDNRHPCRQVVFESQQLDRNPWLTLADAVQDVAASGGDSQVHALTDAWTTSNLHAGQFTASCGLYVRSRNGRPSDFLVCEPTASLVQRQKMDGQGVVYQSQPVFEDDPQNERALEWLASTDSWFRPVDILAGPDGATYVVDMYRAVIEHPQWVPEELKNRPDTWWGNDRGRIWRVVDQNVPPLQQASSARSAVPRGTAMAQWVDQLRSSRGFARCQAVQQFYEMAEQEEYVARLQRLVAEDVDSVAALLATQMLAATDRLGQPQVAQLMRSKNPQIVATVLRRALPGTLGAKQLAERIADSEPDVQFAAILAAGTSAEPLAVKAIVEQAERIGGSTLLRQACASGTQEFVDQVLLRLSQSGNAAPEAASLAVALARRCGHASDQDTVDAVLSSLAPTASPLLTAAIVDGVAEGLRRRGQTAQRFAEQLSPKAQETIAHVLKSARDQLSLKTANVASAQQAVRLVARYGSEQDRDRLLAMLKDQQLAPLHLTCLDLLAETGRSAAARTAVEFLERLDAAARARALELVVGDEAAALRLLERTATGEFPRGLLDVRTTSRLQRHSSQLVRQRADETFGELNADRRAVIAQYSDRVEQAGEPGAGRELFRQHCAACHRIGAIGANVGPDISDSRTQSPQSLLTAILDPNAAIDAAYIRSSLLTIDGRQLEGLLEENSAQRVSLRQTDGTTVVLDPEDIAQTRTTGLSLMPEGFEQQIKPEAMADLIAFIKNWRYLDGP